MRHGLLVLMLACAGLGCAHPVVVVLPALVRPETAEHDPTRPEDGCRYARVMITQSTNSAGFASDDVELTARVTELMRAELVRLGATVTDDPNEAYWSLMVMAAHDRRRAGGFLFSASLALRQLHEGHDPGLTVYSERSGERTATIYSGLGYGPRHVLERTVIGFIRKADAALLPAARGLCSQETQEATREQTLEGRIPVPL